ncbi:MAG: DNA topoisomerase VI subunit B [Methermicoccaceae archaeon]
MKDDFAEELAKHQKSISIAEFFEKNRQLLGFDSSSRAMINSVKEGVDNSLDACEDAGILPDISVRIRRLPEGSYRVEIEDNGPGIVRRQIPNIFGKFLYGSRFHSLRQSRGQQGIGISAVVLYSQLTTGHPTTIVSKTSGGVAHLYEIVINTSTNAPEILREEVDDTWVMPHGTRITFEIDGSYVKGRRQSVYEYLRLTALVNPHARIILTEPSGEEHVFERVTDRLPKRSKEMLPHPYGVEMGSLIKMLKNTEYPTLQAFLIRSFSRVGNIIAKEVCKRANIPPSTAPHELSRDDAKRIMEAFHSPSLVLKTPPIDCLSPIGEVLMHESLKTTYEVDWIECITRSPSVYRGTPFVVEVAIAYGGVLPKDEKVELLRFANRVPLLYQQGACAITSTIESIKWKNYGLSQPGGGLPVGPAVILVHIASVNVPYMSEAKEAIAHFPEIEKEIESALRDVGRRLRQYISRQHILEKKRSKERDIQKMLPLLAQKVAEILDKPTPKTDGVIAKVVGGIFVEANNTPTSGGIKVNVVVKNHTERKQRLRLHEICNFEIQLPEPTPRHMVTNDMNDYVWSFDLMPGGIFNIEYVVETDAPQSSSIQEDYVGSIKRMLEGADEEVVIGDVKQMRGFH